MKSSHSELNHGSYGWTRINPAGLVLIRAHPFNLWSKSGLVLVYISRDMGIMGDFANAKRQTPNAKRPKLKAPKITSLTSSPSPRFYLVVTP
jgi:hypothetical protein